jgi:D-alanyl-D-alanine carboxypeptidase
MTETPGHSEDESTSEELSPAIQQEVAEALLSRWLPEQQDRLGIVGLSAGVLLPGGEVVTASSGLADRERGRPMTPQTPLRMASITKMFTVTAMLIARDQGLLSLDAPVGDLVPELSTVMSPGRDPVPVTLRQVVSHTAGLPHDLPYGAQYWDRTGTDIAFPSAAKVRQHLRDLPLICVPGTTHHYSNVGFMVVGLALEAAFGQPYQQVVRERVLEPLEMSDSFFWSSSRLDQLAKGYRPEGGGLAVAPNVDVGWDTAGGGLCCSVADLMRFIRLHLADAPAGGPQVLGGSSIREAQQPVFVTPGWDGGAGLGWGLRRADGETIVGHSGGLPGFATRMALMPALGLGAALLSNTNRVHVAILLEGLLESLAKLVKAGIEIESRYQDREAPSGVDEVAGHYSTFETSYDVIAAGGRLGLVVLGELDTVSWLEPTGPDGHFVAVSGPARGEPIVFGERRNGRYTQMGLTGMVFHRD